MAREEKCRNCEGQLHFLETECDTHRGTKVEYWLQCADCEQDFDADYEDRYWYPDERGFYLEA